MSTEHMDSPQWAIVGVERLNTMALLAKTSYLAFIANKE
jgi:hypothetical protein